MNNFFVFLMRDIMKNREVKKIAVIANGEPPLPFVIERALRDIDLIIAADGGSSTCMKNGIKPDVVIGDLDSAPDDVQDIFPEAKIIQIDDQESSDMEKAISFALQFFPKRINIIGAIGYRTDHLLANLLFFEDFTQKYGDNIEICIFDNKGQLKYLKPGRHELNWRKGRTVSFFSFGNVCHLSLTGFRYELTDFCNKKPFTSLSNVYENDKCTVEFEGSGLVWYEVYENVRNATGDNDE